jgi:hypothetical protein
MDSDLCGAAAAIAERVLRHIDAVYPAIWAQVPRSARVSVRESIIAAVRAEVGDRLAAAEAADVVMIRKRLDDLERQIDRDGSHAAER